MQALQGALSFDSLESLVRQTSLFCGARLLESFINEHQADHASSITHSDGTVYTYAGMREKTFVTVLGDITLKRAYYTDSQGSGYFPLDEQVGLDTDSLSSGVKRMIGHTASSLSFEESSRMIDHLAALRVGAKQIERAAEALGTEIAEQEKTLVTKTSPCSNTMYLGIDGTGCPVRKEETEGRTGKQPDGSAKTREVKLAVIFSADTTDAEGTQVRDRGSVTYNAAIESAATRDLDGDLSEFASRVEREAVRRGFNQARRRVIIGDGAQWIWNIADEQFPDAIQIIDLYHAKGTITNAAKAIFGAESEFGAGWAKECRDLLEAGDLSAIITKLNPFTKKCKAAGTCIEYLKRNADRLDYPRFRALGLTTSSGIVESGCKHAIGARVKQSGMHWTVNGANAIIALRCSTLKGLFDSFMDRRKGA